MIFGFCLPIAVEQSQPSARRAIRVRDEDNATGSVQFTREPELVKREHTLCFRARRRQGFWPAGNPDNVYLDELAPLQELIHNHGKAAVEAIDDSRVGLVKAALRIKVKDFLHAGLSGHTAPRFQIRQQFVELVFFFERRQAVFHIVGGQFGFRLAGGFRVHHLALQAIECRGL
jgi:hypothetical protein